MGLGGLMFIDMVCEIFIIGTMVTVLETGHKWLEEKIKEKSKDSD